MKKTIYKFRNHFDEVMRTKTSPHSIALGFSIGSLIAILPTPGFGIIIGLLIVIAFKNISKYSLFIALAFWNPITLIPFYYLSHQIGNALFASEPVIKFNVVILDFLYNFSRRFLIGNAIIAIVLSTASYFAVKYITIMYRSKHK